MVQKSILGHVVIRTFYSTEIQIDAGVINKGIEAFFLVMVLQHIEIGARRHTIAGIYYGSAMRM